LKTNPRSADDPAVAEPSPTATRTAPQPAPPAPARAAGARLSPGLIVAALSVGYLLHVAIRLLLARDRSGPVVIADEIGYLLNARVLAGGVPGVLSQAAFYRGGYSLLLAPAFWVTHDPVRAYHAIMLLNALLTSAVFPLLYVFLRRVLAVRQAPALAAAFAAAAYPPLVLNSLLAWSENLLAPLFVLWLLTSYGMVASRRLRTGMLWAAGSGVAVGWLHVTHGRTAPLLALQFLLLLIMVVRRRQTLPLALLAGVAVVAVVVAGDQLNDYLLQRNWGLATSGEFAHLTNVLRQSRGWANLVAVTAGQWWYMAVGSLGLIAVGFAATLAHAVRPLADRRRSPAGPPGQASSTAAEPVESALIAGLLLASWLGVAVLVGMYMFPPTRPDHLAYGRYLDPLAPALLAAGLVALPGWWRSRSLPGRVSALVSACALPLVVVLAYGGTRLFGKFSNNYNDLSLPPLADSVVSLAPARVTLIGITLALALLVMARFSGYLLAAAALVVFLASGSYTTGHLFASTQQQIYDRGMQALRQAADTDGGARIGSRIGYDLSHEHVVGLFVYQYALPEARFVMLRDRDRPPSDLRLIFSSSQWPQAERAGARIVWRDPHREQALWRWPDSPPVAATGSG
jgi:hypothetical protein